jgi:hypothetical protein
LRSRSDYEASVRAIRQTSEEMLARGESEEQVAHSAVDARNRLKAEFRIGLDPDILMAIEARNIALYGDPLGPTAKAQFRRYGSWRAVIDAACRPAELSK